MGTRASVKAPGSAESRARSRLASTMNLSQSEALSITLDGADAVEVRWRVGAAWHTRRVEDPDGVYDEEVLMWLLREGTPLDLARSGMAEPYPEFNVDEFLAWTTMPDRAERRAEVEAGRERLKSEHRARRSQPG
jgi:hypothetical protein